MMPNVENDASQGQVGVTWHRVGWSGRKQRNTHARIDWPSSVVAGAAASWLWRNFLRGDAVCHCRALERGTPVI
jgi:hypothetical protein